LFCRSFVLSCRPMLAPLVLLASLSGAAATEPLLDPAIDASVDTDGDGIPDVEEDLNQDGIVDPDETDPRSIDTDKDNVPDDVERRLGTDPTDPDDVPPIPEPLYIDLIRNLGSKKGELEFNNLAATRFSKRPTIAWGPEVEYVALENFAVELEVPMVDGEVEALKGGFQSRLFSVDHRRFEAGVLAIGYHLLAEKTTILEPSAVVAVRFTGNVHGVTIVGPTAAIDASGRTRVGAMVHPSVFYQASQYATVGVELGHRTRRGEGRESYVLPQLHVNITQWAKVQLGLGAAAEERRIRPFAATRASIEF
jgi:hypothetical protein